MTTLIYQSLVTLDGFVGGPEGELDWHIISPDMHQVYNDQQRRIGGYIMGRKTYEVMRGWDELGGKPDDAPEYRDFHQGWIALPKLVFSRTLASVGPNASLAKGDAVEAVRAFKAATERPVALNGAGLARSLQGTDLIDEYLLYVHPVLLGAGTRLLPEGDSRRALELIDSQTFASGVVAMHYRVVR